MYGNCALVLALTVFVVAAEPRNYPVRLNNYGPPATSIPIVNNHVQTRPMERLPLRTAGCVPRPKTIDNTCHCVKTVLKPKVHNHIISVPSVQRIIQTTATPVVEKIHYSATPLEPTVCSANSQYSVFGGQVVPTQMVPTQMVPTQIVPTQMLPTQFVPTQVVPAQMVKPCMPFYTAF